MTRYDLFLYAIMLFGANHFLGELACEENDHCIPHIDEVCRSYFGGGITKLAVRVGGLLRDVFVCAMDVVVPREAVIVFLDDRVLYAFGIKAISFLMGVFVNGIDGMPLLSEANKAVIDVMIDSLRKTELDSAGRELYERLIKYIISFA